MLFNRVRCTSKPGARLGDSSTLLQQGFGPLQYPSSRERYARGNKKYLQRQDQYCFAERQFVRDPRFDKLAREHVAQHPSGSNYDATPCKKGCTLTFAKMPVLGLFALLSGPSCTRFSPRSLDIVSAYNRPKYLQGDTCPAGGPPTYSERVDLVCRHTKTQSLRGLLRLAILSRADMCVYAAGSGIAPAPNSSTAFALSYQADTCLHQGEVTVQLYCTSINTVLVSRPVLPSKYQSSLPDKGLQAA